MNNRVLFVVFPSDSAANGSMESMTLLMEGLRQTVPVVVTHRETEFARRWRQIGIPVFLVPLSYEEGRALEAGGLRGVLRRLWSYIRTNFIIAGIMRRESCHLIHCNELYALWHSAAGALCVGARVLLNLRDTKQSTTRSFRLKASLAYALSHYRITLSKEMSDFWGGATIFPSRTRRRTEAIYSAVDLTRFSPLAKQLRDEGRSRHGLVGCFTLGYVATFKPKKNQEALLRNLIVPWAKLLPRLKIVFLGDFEPEHNPLAEACQRIVHEEGLSTQVDFKGFVSDVESWYPLFDLTLVATEHEGLARCMIESMACGTPVVSFAVCSAREILEYHECGFVVPVGDYTAMGEKVALLVRKPELREQLGQRSRAVAERLFEPTASVSAYEKTYQRMLES